MKKALLILMVWLVVGGTCLLTSCVTRTNPETGQKESFVDPNVAGQVEGGVETAVGIMTVLSPFFPALLPILAGLGGVLGTWRNMKPKLVSAQARSSLYYNTTAAVVRAIEDFKATNPDDWGKLETKLVRLIGPEAKSVIDALRGIPPKV